MPICLGVSLMSEVIKREGGKIIVFEGIDGCGKDTQLELFAETLRKILPSGVRVIETFEPWRVPESPCGMRIDRIMEHKEHKIDPGDNGIDPVKLQTIYTADRFIHWTKLIIPELLKGSVVLCGRERLSTFAYGHAFGIPLKEMLDWHRLLPIPDLTVYLRVSLETAIERMKNRGKSVTYFEKKKKNLRKVITSYEEIIDSKFCVLEKKVVGGEGDKINVHNRVVEAVMNDWLFHGAFLEKAREIVQEIQDR